MRSYNKIPILLGLLSAPLSGQICTQANVIATPSICPNTGFEAGPPTLRAFVTGAATMFPSVSAIAAPQPQPQIVHSANIVAGNDTFISSDPRTCPNTGTCIYNNPAVLEAYADSMLKPLCKNLGDTNCGLGLKSLDMNMWYGPIFESSQYAAVCASLGTCFTPTGSLVGWYQHTLTNTYDAFFSYVNTNYPGTLIRLAPMPTGDVVLLCGITEGAPTEAQIQNCLEPAAAAIVARWHVDYLTPVHEPCGQLSLVLGTSGCAITVSDWNTLMEAMIPAARANSQNAGIKLGPGLTVEEDGGLPYTCPSAGNYICACYHSTGNVADYCGMDVYPQDGNSAGYYTGQLSRNQTQISAITAATCQSGGPCEAWWNEFSFLRWGPTSGAGEGGTYWGCGYVEWLQDGTNSNYIQVVNQKWSPTTGLTGQSIYPSASFMFITTDAANTHCDGTDGYLPLAMAHAGQVTQTGLEYGRMAAGQAATVQGAAKIQGGKIQ